MFKTPPPTPHQQLLLDLVQYDTQSGWLGKSVDLGCKALVFVLQAQGARARLSMGRCRVERVDGGEAIEYYAPALEVDGLLCDRFGNMGEAAVCEAFYIQLENKGFAVLEQIEEWHDAELILLATQPHPSGTATQQSMHAMVQHGRAWAQAQALARQTPAVRHCPGVPRL